MVALRAVTPKGEEERLEKDTLGPRQSQVVDAERPMTQSSTTQSCCLLLFHSKRAALSWYIIAVGVGVENTHIKGDLRVGA